MLLDHCDFDLIWVFNNANPRIVLKWVRWEVDTFMDTARFDILERGPGNRRPRTSDFCVLEREANWGWGGGTGPGICVHCESPKEKTHLPQHAPKPRYGTTTKPHLRSEENIHLHSPFLKRRLNRFRTGPAPNSYNQATVWSLC